MTLETHSGVAMAWLLAQERRSLVVSDWSLTEFGCAIAMKYRRGFIDADFRSNVEQAWALLVQEFTRAPVESAHFRQAARLGDSAPRGLRSGDALHLAIAIGHNCELATFDRDLADAARAIGIAVHPA